MSDGKCHCLIKHPETPEEREQIVKALESARANCDTTAVMLCLSQLTTKCPAQEKKS